MFGRCQTECEGLYSAQWSFVMIVLRSQGDKAMGYGQTHRVCPSCGAVAGAERVTCDHCGSLTALKINRTVENQGALRAGSS